MKTHIIVDKMNPSHAPTPNTKKSAAVVDKIKPACAENRHWLNYFLIINNYF